MTTPSDKPRRVSGEAKPKRDDAASLRRFSLLFALAFSLARDSAAAPSAAPGSTGPRDCCSANFIWLTTGSVVDHTRGEELTPVGVPPTAEAKECLRYLLGVVELALDVFVELPGEGDERLYIVTYYAPLSTVIVREKSLGSQALYYRVDKATAEAIILSWLLAPPAPVDDVGASLPSYCTGGEENAIMVGEP